MKYVISILALSVCAGCATRKEPVTKSVAVVPGTSISAKRLPTVRTPETVKAYPVGRYTDPNYPDEMHERHTVYRREQSPDWNYLPDPPMALPLGPTVAVSNPSPSYYAKAEGEMNAQQRAYADALQEQNRAMKKRIESLQQEAGKVQGLEKEIDRLKKQIDDTPEPTASPRQPEPTKTDNDNVFSAVEPELPTWEEGVSDQSQDFLISQMRLNDEFASELAQVEQRQRAVLVMQQKTKRAISEDAEFIQIRDAAEWLGVPFSSLRQYVSRGLLPSYKLGRHRLFRKKELLEALRQTTKATLDEVLR